MLTGQFSFEQTTLDYFDKKISDAKQENQQVEGYDAYIVLDFNIEKYRDITVARDDITPDEAHRIATMQSAHQSILEYTYQFTLAESTQDRLNEICYTAFITITSTIIVMGATWGLNKAFSKYGSQHFLNKADDIYAQGELTASMQKSINSLTTSAASMMAKAGRSASMNAYIVVKSVIEETLEELYVDPMIEAYVTNKVKDLGYDQTAQILWSGLAESGREQFLSSVTAFARAGASIKTQTDIQLSLDLQSQSLNVEQRLQLVQEQIQAKQDTKTNWKKAMAFIGEGISTFLLCAGAISGGIGGSLGVSFGNILTVAAVSTEGIKFINDMGDIILKKDPSFEPSPQVSESTRQQFISKMDEIRDSMSTLTNEQKYQREMNNYITLLQASTRTIGAVQLIDTGPPEPPDPDNLIKDIGQKLKNQYFEAIPNILTSRQINTYSEYYQKKVVRTCVKYGLKFKEILINEYGHKMLDLRKTLPLSTHFSWRLDKNIAKVTNQKRDKAVGSEALDKVKVHITNRYKNLRSKKATKEMHYKNVITFIQNYLKFSEYVASKSGQGQFSISNIKNIENSIELAPKSWLFENIRYMLPKRFGLSIRDDLLTWFLFGDALEYGKVSKLKWTTEGKELFKRMGLDELLSIDYRISKLTIDDFENKGIEITGAQLFKLRQSVSYLIYYFIFGGYHQSTYVSETTDKGLEVGPYYFTPEYAVLRAAFFLAAEANSGETLSLGEFSSAMGIKKIQSHLYRGYGFGGDHFEKISRYIKTLLKNMPSGSDTEIILAARQVIDTYENIYEARQRELQDIKGDRSWFQGRVREFMEDHFGLEFFPEKQVRMAVGADEVTVINDDGDPETIRIHGNFKFDGYLELNRLLKDFLGLDDKWIGIAFEAMGTYWHGPDNPSQQEKDRRKRLICKDKNVILIEISEAFDSNNWLSEVISQLEEQAGIRFTKEQFSKLRNFLGNFKRP